VARYEIRDETKLRLPEIKCLSPPVTNIMLREWCWPPEGEWPGTTEELSREISYCTIRARVSKWLKEADSRSVLAGVRGFESLPSHLLKMKLARIRELEDTAPAGEYDSSVTGVMGYHEYS
jgi:hypothetical protein